MIHHSHKVWWREMGGLAILFFIGLYLVIAFKVVGKFKASRYKWLVLALVILLPSGDAVVGRVYLKYLCAKEGGLKVYRVAEHVEGFMDDNRDYWVQRDGYQFTEDYPVNGRVTRYLKQGAQVAREENVFPKSKYKVRLLHIGQVQDVYMRDKFTVESIPAGEILATDTQVYFNGGWAEKFLAAFSDAGGGAVASCGYRDSIVRYKNLVTATLKLRIQPVDATSWLNRSAGVS